MIILHSHCYYYYFIYIYTYTNNEVLSKTEALLGFFAVKRVNSLVRVAIQYILRTCMRLSPSYIVAS